MSAAFPNVASLAWNASSSWRASATVKLFLAPRILWAQFAASSAEAMVLKLLYELLAQCGRRLDAENWLGGIRNDLCAATAWNLLIGAVLTAVEPATVFR